MNPGRPRRLVRAGLGSFPRKVKRKAGIHLYAESKDTSPLNPDDFDYRVIDNAGSLSKHPVSATEITGPK